MLRVTVHNIEYAPNLEHSPNVNLLVTFTLQGNLQIRLCDLQMYLMYSGISKQISWQRTSLELPKLEQVKRKILNIFSLS